MTFTNKEHGIYGYGKSQSGSVKANVIIDEVVKRVSQWRELALRLGISKGEIDYFSQKFTRILSHTDFNG